jgi:hypothetical protein
MDDNEFIKIVTVLNTVNGIVEKLSQEFSKVISDVKKLQKDVKEIDGRTFMLKRW